VQVGAALSADRTRPARVEITVSEFFALQQSVSFNGKTQSWLIGSEPCSILHLESQVVSAMSAIAVKMPAGH
jgi:hypothetical protein